MVYTNDDIKEKMNNKEKRALIFRIISAPFIVVLIALVCYIGYLKLIVKTDSISIFGYRLYSVVTGSMVPNYNIGDLIIIKEKAQDDIQVNDVINFTNASGKSTTTHRVIEIVNKDGKKMYKTKGDNNSSADVDLVSSNQILGTVVFKINKLGALITKFLTEVGMFVIFILIIMSYIHSSREEEKRIAREDARRLYNIPKYEKENKI